MRPAHFLLALLVLAAPAGGHTEVRPLLCPLGLSMGMTIAQAVQLLVVRKGEFKVRLDDKPFRGESHKVKARLPDGSEAGQLTLYFVKQRLWQITLRSIGDKLRAAVEAKLGKPDRQDKDCREWRRPKELQAVACCRARCQLVDFGEWVRAGKPRSEAEKAYLGLLRPPPQPAPSTD